MTSKKDIKNTCTHSGKSFHSLLTRLLTVSGIVAQTFLGAPSFAMANDAAKQYMPWAVYYSDKAPLEAFEPYKLLVLDSTYHPPLLPLKDRGKTVLGYISLGEAENHRHYFNRVKDAGILLQENEHWPGSFYVDMREQFWTKLVIEELIPNILRQGFDGIFLDTLDNPVHLENYVDSKKYKGMKQAAARLVRTIRRNFPDMPIMMNRGVELLPYVEQDITMLLAESLRADQNPLSKAYRMTPEDEYRFMVDTISQSQRRQPNLIVMSLDYWDPKDTDTIRKLYAIERENGYLPYVSTVELNTLVAEPSR